MLSLCSICHEEIGSQASFSCGFHSCHYDCFASWFFTLKKTAVKDATCVVCKADLKNVLDMAEMESIIDKFEEHVHRKIILDDADEIMRVVGCKDSVFYTKQIIKECIEHGSKECLERLKKIQGNCLFHHILTVDLIAELFLDRNHIKTCWILGDFTVNCDEEVKNSDLLDRLIQGCQYDTLRAIFVTCMTQLSFEELIRIAEFLYLTSAAGIALFSVNSKSPFRIMGKLSPAKTELGCYFLRKVMPEIARRHFKDFSEDEVDYFRWFLGTGFKCCRDAHFWEALSLAIIKNDLEFFEFLWGLPGIDHKLTIPYREISEIIQSSDSSVFYTNFFKRHQIGEAKKLRKYFNIKKG